MSGRERGLIETLYQNTFALVTHFSSCFFAFQVLGISPLTLRPSPSPLTHPRVPHARRSPRDRNLNVHVPLRILFVSTPPGVFLDQLPKEATTIPSDVVCTFSCDGHHDCGGESSPSLPPLSGLPALPAGARLADSFLTALVRLCRLEELPLTVLARTGYRTTGAAADADGTDEVSRRPTRGRRGA